MPLVPSSSVAAVATKSFGAAFAHCARVSCLSSGDEKTAARTTVSMLTTTSATTNSLTRS